MSYHQSESTPSRFPFEVKTKSKAQERTCTRIFHRINLRAGLCTGVTLMTGLILTLTGVKKWENESTRGPGSGLLVLTGLAVLSPGIYWLADMLGLLRNLQQEYSGSVVVSQDDDFESDLDSGDRVVRL